MQFVGTEPSESVIPEFEQVVSQLKSTVDTAKFVQYDSRYNRKTQSLPGHFIVIDRDLIDILGQENALIKYHDDWNRMKSGFQYCVDEALKDKESRRMVCYNTENYYETFQCFNLFQFTNTERGEFDMYVYQRSSDIAKLKDDMIFFANVIQEFEEQTNIKVTKIVLVFGNLHYEI